MSAQPTMECIRWQSPYLAIIPILADQFFQPGLVAVQVEEVPGIDDSAPPVSTPAPRVKLH